MDATGLKMINEKKWINLFGFEKRNEQDSIEQHHCDLALAIQTVTEEIILKMAVEARKITKSENICLAGGVALNCVANGELLNEKKFSKIYILYSTCIR